MSNLSVRAAAEEKPHRLAIVDRDRTWTWQQVAEHVADRSPPRLLAPGGEVEDLLDIFAALERATPIALVHARWSQRELDAARERIERSQLPQADITVFTSGSKGRPKAVRLSRQALLAAAGAHAAAMPFEDDDRWMLTLPLAHVGGLAVLVRTLFARTGIALGPARFDPAAWFDQAARTRTTIVSLVPTMLRRLLDEGTPAPPTLRAVLVGGASCSEKLLRRGRATGWPLLATYGMSETFGQVCTQRLGDADGGDVGTPLPGIDVRIGPRQEILVSGPTLMDGYLDDQSGIVDGWFRTGDAGHFDSCGRLVVSGRLDTRINSGGENVDPQEVENAIVEHADCASACVVGLPVPVWGERVAALVACPAKTPTAAELKAHLGPRIAAFKHPKQVVFVPVLPRLPSGKVDRETARAWLSEAGTCDEGKGGV